MQSSSMQCNSLSSFKPSKLPLDQGSDRSTVPSGRVRSRFETAPAPGEAIEVASGIWWLKLPLSAALDAINVYVLENDQGWTLVDTGNNTPICRTALEAAFAQPPFAPRPVTHVLATHYHPDHIGLAGLLCDRGAVLQTTRTCWLQSRLLQLDRRELPCEDEIRFVQRAGMKGVDLAAFRRRSPSNFAQQVLPLPHSYERIREGDRLKIGDRTWTVHCGYGHAAEHVTLWSEDGFVITGDQILPGISSNLSVHSSEPEADLVSEWISSCWRFAALATEQTVCLPGHNSPFTGVTTRCQQLIASQEAVLNRLLAHLSRPCTAIDCLEVVYRRRLQAHEWGTLMAETVGFLNHLHQRGLIRRELAAQTYLWYKNQPQESGLPVHFASIEPLVF
jgi:glyoxylase-like metal-dependent hydrolase (beta-lactamase superfamily II)